MEELEDHSISLWGWRREGKEGGPEMMALEFKRSLRSIITAFLNFIVAFVQKAARCQKFKPEGSHGLKRESSPIHSTSSLLSFAEMEMHFTLFYGLLPFHLTLCLGDLSTLEKEGLVSWSRTSCTQIVLFLIHLSLHVAPSSVLR